MFLSLLAVVGGIMLLANGTFRWRRFAAAALLGVVACYSFANGILFWPIGLGILLVATVGAKERKVAIFVWILVATLTLLAYFHNYHKPEEHPQLSLIFKMPLTYFAFVFKYFGAICAEGLGGDTVTDGIFAFVFGLTAIITFGWAGSTLIWRKIANVRTLLPYFAMGLYSVGCAMVTGVGRLGFGSDYALSSRYSTTMTPLYAGLIVFLILLAKGGKHQFNQMIARWSLMAVIILLVLSSIFSVDYARNYSQAEAYGRARLLYLAAHPKADIDYSGLSYICSYPTNVVERYPILVKHQLSIFRGWKIPADSQ